MASASDDLQAKLTALRAAFMDSLPQRLDSIEQLWGDLTDTAWDSGSAAHLRLLAHGLKGSAATYGLWNVSQAASTLESGLAPLVEEKPDGAMPDAPTDAERTDIDSAVRGLREALANPEEGDAVAAPELPGRSPDGPDRSAKVIYILDPDEAVAANLSVQISHYGFSTDVFTGIDDLADAVTARRPDAIVSDLAFLQGQGREEEAVRRILTTTEPAIPAVILSIRDDLTARVEAVRAGAQACFGKPADVGELVGTLDLLTETEKPDPYRVLVVDDDKAMANYHAAVLRTAGIETQVLIDPMAVMQPLTEFDPDLLLLDMYMPGCRGTDLAAAIRQYSVYASLPIVYLSTEHDRDIQLAAIARGADDFLTKPIRPDRLISSVTARAARQRVLRALVSQDAMTKLLNHTASKERLAVELSRAMRTKRPLTFGLLDIDHFKKVNDTYGHPVGDSVIKNLSRLLPQRLRKSDAVGRYGGEEFAVILPDTPLADARLVMDKLRQSFAGMQQWTGSETFKCSFSCGLAGYPGYDHVDAMIEAADAALYEAKKGGRNRVEVAASESGATNAS